MGITHLWSNLKASYLPHMPQFLKSRTFWTIVAMFVVGGGNAVVPVLPVAIQAIALGALGVLATYFHVNPSQNYTA